MPPRQPLKLKASKPKAKANLVAALAAELGLPENKSKPAPDLVKRPRLPTGFSPYPDLAMAIAMLAKQQQAVAADGERAILVSRWLKQLQGMHAEMQKLHKLEQLAGRLKGK
jgi:hypothetical protein